MYVYSIYIFKFLRHPVFNSHDSVNISCLLLMQWFGDAEKLTKALFSFASRLAPVIIFVDEVRPFSSVIPFDGQ